MRNQFERILGLLKWAQAVLLLTLALGATSAYSASKGVLVLGDSLSAEYGLGRGDGWVALLEKRIADNNLKFDIVNASISGETTSGGKSRLPALLEKNRPAVLIVELGANDGLRGLPLAETRKNLQDIVSAAKKANARVLLVGMQLPPNYGTDYTKRFAALFPALAKDSKVALVPFLLEGVVTQPQLFQADRIHPTAAAHPIILDNVWPHLKPLLGK
jgi:acyl-CoA thioesterase-1